MHKSTKHKSRLVQDTTTRLRELILGQAPGVQIGSLKDVAEQLDVGIVTVQQSARILEHEGLLAVKRGPGGGYYGTRPDSEALERAFASYLRVHGYSNYEPLEMMILLDCENMPAAARCQDESLQNKLRTLYDSIDQCDSIEQRVQFENNLRETLFSIVNRPLVEMLTRVTLQLYNSKRPQVFADKEGINTWKTARKRILKAVLDRDEELARFEAERYRRVVLQCLATIKATSFNQHS